jgi:hypothetical protein
MAVYEIPLQPGTPQTFSILLSGVTYRLTFTYRNDPGGQGGWCVDIADANGNAILSGVPLVTGANLLEQYDYLNFGGQLWVASVGDPDLPPTFDSLGDDTVLYWIA